MQLRRWDLEAGEFENLGEDGYRVAVAEFATLAEEVEQIAGHEPDGTEVVHAARTGLNVHGP